MTAFFFFLSYFSVDISDGVGGSPTGAVTIILRF